MATHTVKESGGDFTTLASALSDAGTGASDIISIEGAWTVDDTSGATVADDSITIQTDASSRHPGYEDETTNHYRLVVNSGHALTLNNTGCVVEGLMIVQDGTGASDEGVRFASTVNTLRNCIIRAGTVTSQQDGVHMSARSGTINLEQCIIHGFSRAGCNAQIYTGGGHSQTWNVNSCFVWNNGHEAATDGGGYGAWVQDASSDATYNIQNSMALLNSQASGPNDYNELGSGTITWNISNSIDSDNSIATVLDTGSGNLASRTATDNASPGAGDFVIVNDITTSPYDLRLVDNSTDNDAQDMHATATAHSLTIPSTDIVGTARPDNTNYECGPFEIVTAVATRRIFIVT